MALAIALIGTTVAGQATLAAKRAPAIEMAPVVIDITVEAIEGVSGSAACTKYAAARTADHPDEAAS